MLAVLVFASPASAQTPDDGFLATLGELRDASFLDKEAIVGRLSASGHASVHPVLTALLEDRLYFRTSDQKIFIIKTADESLTSWTLSTRCRSRRRAQPRATT